MIINKIHYIIYTFVPNKTFGRLSEISPTNHIFLKTFNFQLIDQNSQPLEIEYRINLTMVIK